MAVHPMAVLLQPTSHGFHSKLLIQIARAALVVLESEGRLLGRCADYSYSTLRTRFLKAIRDTLRRGATIYIPQRYILWPHWDILRPHSNSRITYPYFIIRLRCGRSDLRKYFRHNLPKNPLRGTSSTRPPATWRWRHTRLTQHDSGERTGADDRLGERGMERRPPGDGSLAPRNGGES